MHDVKHATSILHSLKDIGVKLSIDDFGTGYSSLAYLKRFPIHALKIDGSFVRGIAHDRDDVVIAEMILALGKSMGLEVVAEGVETEAQAEFFRARKCDRIQGFWVGRPVAAGEVVF